MSYSIGSAEESSVYTSESSVSASTYGRPSKPPPKKWSYAQKWSAAFCDNIEERLACGADRWVAEEEDTITIIEEASVEDEAKKVEKSKKSYSFLADYINSKTPKNDENEKKEKNILNQFIQGNHRGWGTLRSTSKKSSPKDKSGDIVKETILMSYGSTFDDTVDETDAETCDDTYDRTLEYASTYDSSRDGTYDSAPDDEEQSYDEPKRRPQPSVNKRSSRSTVSTASSNDRSGRVSRVSDASRNDSARYSNRERDTNLDRESPSFGSRNNRQLQKQHQVKRKNTRSFDSRPSVSTDGSSQRSTFEKSSFVTPQKMLSTYQSPSKPTKNSRVKVTKESRTTQASQTRSSRMSSRKVELGRRRATERMIKEQAKAQPKAFPYVVNHSLFHQNLANKQARALNLQRKGVV